MVANGEDTNEELILFIKPGIAGAGSLRTLERVRANMSKAIGKGVEDAKAPFGLRRAYYGQEVLWQKDQGLDWLGSHHSHSKGGAVGICCDSGRLAFVR